MNNPIQTKFSKENKAQVWSCGGGTQSCAIAALIIQGKLPKPDISVIADTGYETRTTWEYMDIVIVPALRKVGVELTKVTGDGFGRFWMTLFAKNADEPLIPAYSTQTGKPVKLPNWCSTMWKGEVLDRWFSRHYGLTRSMLVKWIGFSRDEQTRIIRLQQTKDGVKGLIRFPLVEDVPTTRHEAIKLVESMGWPTPPRSACYMCPNHNDHEWRIIKNERPDEFQKAVEIERQIQAVDPDAWLHKSCVPLDQVDFTQPDDLFSRPCDSGVCFV